MSRYATVAARGSYRPPGRAATVAVTVARPQSATVGHSHADAVNALLRNTFHCGPRSATVMRPDRGHDLGPTVAQDLSWATVGHRPTSMAVAPSQASPIPKRNPHP